jgi:Zn-dependent protease with chaperone function
MTVKSNEDPGYHNLIAGATLVNNTPTIIMGQDLIKKGSRREVAFVFAHELGHIMQGDLEKIAKSGTLDRFLLCASVGIIASGSQYLLWNLYKGAWRHCLIGASLAAVGGYAAKKLIGKAHKREKEADLFAAELLQSADGGIQFFERVQNAPIPFYLRLADRIIHPSEAARIQALKEWQKKRRNKDDIQAS